ncbi:tetraspanin-11 [Bombyx mori]|uniref:Tetraspanin n=1 Tax=Bombyx mori TaxID=7091 RepID=A0A8R2GD43_BOMMO|nr:tetraspanin-11 [Bombyx mori]
MGMSRCYSLMKYLLIVFNIIFMFVGLGCVTFASWALWEGSAAETASGRAALGAVLAWGLALLVGAALALGGAVRGSCALLGAACALLALAAAAEAAAACWGAAHLPRLHRALRDTLSLTVRQHYGLLPSRTQIIDAIQEGLECCGADSARDWQESWWSQRQVPSSPVLDLSVSAPALHYSVPASCCKSREVAACEAARVLAGASGAGRGVHGAGCAGRVLWALQHAARLPLSLGALMLALHALTLLLTLALALRPAPPNAYKA